MAKTNKGSEWERECSRMLSLWWTDGERDDVIWRTSNSGGRATSRIKKGKIDPNNMGDLRADDPIAQTLFDFLHIECKRGYAGKRPSEAINVLYWLDRPLTTKPPLLWQWWIKAENERIIARRSRSVIIFRRTGKRASIFMEADFFWGDLGGHHGSYNGMILSILLPNDKNDPDNKTEEFVILDLEVFLDWCTPETIRQLQEV